jgi:hypothetical protein
MQDGGLNALRLAQTVRLSILLSCERPVPELLGHWSCVLVS